MMDLTKILRGVKHKPKSRLSHVKVRSITDDSRSVTKGAMFIAIKGCSADGQKYIDDAVKRGASVIVSDRQFHQPDEVIKVIVENARLALPTIADNYFGHPSEALKLVGVTGTNGKTTITYIIENIIKSAGKEAGVIGTINYRIKGKVMPSGNTTPGPIKLISMLADMVKQDVGYAVMEVSSHSLEQHRIDGVRLDAAVFTNISPEHLDYHKTISNYFKAKTMIFKRLKSGGTAILNNDDKRVSRLRRSIKNNVMTYGINKSADIMAKDINISVCGSKFKVLAQRTRFEINTRLIGMHNISNILAGVGVSLSLGIDPKHIKKGIESIVSVPGRLEPVRSSQEFKVFVDYAHTPDALFNVLSLLRSVAKKDIITVFGCGGNRDKTKRPVMGRVACELSDQVIITSDNPRFEEPHDIIGEIESGVRGSFANYNLISDRRIAIAEALKLATKGSIVIIAGKGHENYQIINGRTLPFDDRIVVRDILKNK